MEFDALKILLKKKDVQAQKADARKDYKKLCNMKKLLMTGQSLKKFSKDKILNHVIHMENRITDVLKKLRNKREISRVQRPGIMNALAKVQKLCYRWPSIF